MKPVARMQVAGGNRSPNRFKTELTALFAALGCPARSEFE